MKQVMKYCNNFQDWCDRIYPPQRKKNNLCKSENCGTGKNQCVFLAELLYIPEEGIGDVSDGHHTFDELYSHRAVLFSVICNQNLDVAWKSKFHYDGTMYDDMFIVGIKTPTGNMSYHYNNNRWGLFSKVKEIDYAPEYDGYTPKESLERLLSIL